MLHKLIKRFCMALGLLFVLAAGLLKPTVADAHAYLLSSNPEDQAVLSRAPAQITMKFSEQLDPELVSLKLSGTGSAPIPLEVHVSPHDPYGLIAHLPRLGNGSYALRWSAISEDGHPVGGVLRFAIGKADQAMAGEGTDSGLLSVTVLVILRFIGESGVLLGTGWTFVSHLGRKYGVKSVEERMVRRLRILGTIGLFLTVILLFWAYSATLPDQSLLHWLTEGKWRLVLATPFVVMLLTQLFFLIMLALPGMVEGWYLFFWGCLTASLAFGGHARGTRWVPLALGARIVHLFAGALWLGGLAYLALLCRKKEDRQLSSFRPFFTRLVGLVAVLALVSGFMMALLQTDVLTILSFDAAWSFFFGMKVLFYFGMIIFAVGQSRLWKKENRLLAESLHTEWAFGMILLFLGVCMSQLAYPLAH
jgi:copper transport protein